MSRASQWMAAILLISLPTVMFGGHTLLTFLRTGEAGYLDNPVRQDFFRAGHAHAGVWIILALVGLLYVDRSNLSQGAQWVVRIGMAIAPILISMGFFLSMASPRATKPNGLIALVYLGAACLAAGVLTLAVGLIRGRPG
jgi:heme/copper-type cytochrome/quinol oxidase subunit 4